jgi:hypothetical protein
MDADDNKGSGELKMAVYMSYMTKMQSITMTDYDYAWSQVKLLLNIEYWTFLFPWYIETLSMVLLSSTME